MKSLSLEKNHHLLLEILGISANGANQKILQRVLKSCVSTVKQHNLFNWLKTHHKLLDNLCLKAKKSNAMVTNAFKNQLKSSVRKKTLHSSPAHKDGEKPPTQPYYIWTNILSPGFWKMVSMLDKSNYFFQSSSTCTVRKSMQGKWRGISQLGSTLLRVSIASRYN